MMIWITSVAVLVFAWWVANSGGPTESYKMEYTDWDDPPQVPDPEPVPEDDELPRYCGS